VKYKHKICVEEHAPGSPLHKVVRMDKANNSNAVLDREARAGENERKRGKELCSPSLVLRSDAASRSIHGNAVTVLH
jgi:hypothetical protein